MARQLDRERADQRVDGGLGGGVMLVAGGAEQRSEARGRNQPAEGIAGGGAFGHVARRDLKHVEHAVEIGGEHAAPLFLGAVNEGVSSAAADASIGEAAVDPAEPVQGGRHRGCDRGCIADVADAGIDLAGTTGHGRGGIFVLLGVTGPDRNIAAGGGERLRDAKADAAIAAGDDGHTARQVENTRKRFHGSFPSGLARVGPRVRGRADVSDTNHGQARPENQIWLRD